MQSQQANAQSVDATGPPAKTAVAVAELWSGDLPFRLLVSTIQDYAIFFLDRDGHVVTWNDGAERIKGYRADEIIGRHFSCFYLPEDVVQGKPARELQVAAADGRYQDDGWRIRKDGSRFWASVVITALHDATGQLLGFGKVTRDMTAQRNAAEKFRNLLEATPDALVVTDQQGRIVLVNSQTEQLFNYGREELIGQPVEMLIPERFRDRHPGHRAAYTADPRVRPMGANLDLFAKRKDGSEFPAEISLSPLHTADGMLVTSAIRDVTERKRFEQTLQQAKEDAEAANKELEAFCYSVSHDLRAPLRTTDGFSRILLDDHGSQLDATGRDYLQRIRTASQQMGRLIDDLLRLSRITRGELAREETDLTKMARTIVAGLRATQPDRVVDWRIADGLMVKVDSQLFRVALENLLGNAWKFTAKHPHAVIEFGAEQQTNERVFFVRDDGAGFDMAYVGKLFGAFQRLHSPREFEGTGIGLATVQRIIRRHGGRIWAEGAIEAGATFYFTLTGAAEP